LNSKKLNTFKEFKIKISNEYTGKTFEIYEIELIVSILIKNKKKYMKIMVNIHNLGLK